MRFPLALAPLALALAAALGLSAPLHAATPTAPADKAAAAVTLNPFLQPSALAYQLPRFDRIRDEHYVPAFEQGMKQQLAEIDAIASNPAEPTFENTIVALERSGATLTRVSNVFFNLVTANTNDTMEAIQTEMAPKLAAHQDAIALDGKLYARVKSLYDRRNELGRDAESVRLIERYHTDFVRAGANLSEADKARLKDINAQLAALSTDFSQNVLKGTNAGAVVVDDKAALAGLAENEIAAAAEAGKERKLDGKYVIALQNTSGQPALASIEDRALRQKLQQASVARGVSGEFDNRPVVLKLAKLRAERAALLGYPDFASYALEDQTAKTTAAVNAMLGKLAPAAVANAKREAADMQAIVNKEDGGFQVAAWDWAYYAEKVRQARFNFDESQLRPYFEMESVLQNGVFFAANKLYGLSFKERKDLPVYQADVRVFEVFDEGDEPLGLFLLDWYARDNKRGGAWMNEYVSQNGLSGTRPVVANHLNIPKPPKGEPTLLTFDEVTTAFHEFGHALHGLFSQVKYPRFAGTAVPNDFVEYPSQVNEMWATWPEVLKNYAKHYQTGAPMPQELLDKVLATQQFNQGFTTTEYLAAAMLDQRWHQLKPDQVPTDVEAFEATALHEAGVDFAPVPPRYRTGYFSHIWGGGYSAAYYAYIWSEVLDADSVEWFREHGGLSRENGDHFRRTLLSRGGSEDAMKLFRDFRGREPDIKPLLERRGLDQPAAP
jgi:peptidyl-dipeptidase Dcp